MASTQPDSEYSWNDLRSGGIDASGPHGGKYRGLGKAYWRRRAALRRRELERTSFLERSESVQWALMYV